MPTTHQPTTDALRTIQAALRTSDYGAIRCALAPLRNLAAVQDVLGCLGYVRLYNVPSGIALKRRFMCDVALDAADPEAAAREMGVGEHMAAARERRAALQAALGRAGSWS